MLPSMPLISSPFKDGQSEENCSNEENEIAIKALDLSLSAKKSSPLKHVTPILRKYSTQRKGKGNKKLGPQYDQMQTLRPIAPKPVMVVIAPTPEDPKNESSGVEVKEEVAEHNKKEDRKDNEDELAALMRASTTIQSGKGRVSNIARKKSKQVRDMEASIMLLTPDDPVVREEKSYGFAQAYFLKVKERLEGTELYQAFLHTMNEFGTSIIEVRDLYYKVTSLLSQHPDLSEEFLAFLLPEQAMQCGKLMEYLMITRMRDFFRKLEMYFEKQPHQMRKFYSALSTLCGQADVSLTDVRSAILPLLKGNSVLIDSFLNLLPEEKPPDSMMTEFEDMEIGDCNKLRDGDLFETVIIPNQQDAFGGDGCVCNCHQMSPDNKTAHCLSCGTRFIHGKIFLQTGRLLRPAKVEFDTETTYQSIKRLSAKTRPKVTSRKRTTIRFGNSQLKRAHVASSNSDRKGSRAGKTKTGQKARASKSCRRLVKPKTQNNSRQSSLKSSAKGSQSRTSARSAATKLSACDESAVVATSVLQQNNLVPQTCLENDILPPVSEATVVLQVQEEEIPVSETLEVTLPSDLNTRDVGVLDAEMKECDVVNKAVSSAWTRDEDKVILQMYKLEHSFQEISEHLPQRSVHEIQSRFETLINIMKLMSEERMEQDIS